LVCVLLAPEDERIGMVEETGVMSEIENLVVGKFDAVRERLKCRPGYLSCVSESEWVSYYSVDNGVMGLCYRLNEVVARLMKLIEEKVGDLVVRLDFESDDDRGELLGVRARDIEMVSYNRGGDGIGGVGGVCGELFRWRARDILWGDYCLSDYWRDRCCLQETIVMVEWIELEMLKIGRFSELFCASVAMFYDYLVACAYMWNVHMGDIVNEIRKRGCVAACIADRWTTVQES
jgi:hypothetical protein